MKKNVNTWFFIAVLLVVLYLAILVVRPYLSYIILSVVIAYTARPLYKKIQSYLKRSWLSSGIMVLLLILILFIPSLFLVKSLTEQGTRTITAFDVESIKEVNDFIQERTDIDLDLEELATNSAERIKNFLINEGLRIIGSIADVLIGIIIMFFVLFYLFKDGEKIYHTIVDVLPLQKSHKHVLFGEMELVTNAVIYGQLIIAIIQGVLGGLAFAIFGLPSPVFWGFIMAIISFLPLVGTPMIYIPAGILQLLQQHYVAGIGLIIWGIVVNANVDSVFRPLIISDKSRLNAALILIGVIGGLKAFGFMGFVLGPLVLGLLIALLQVFKQDFKPSEELEKATHERQEDLVIPLKPRPTDEHRKDEKKH